VCSKEFLEFIIRKKSQSEDDIVLYEDSTVYEFLPYSLDGFSLDKKGILVYDFDILKLFPEFDLKKIEDETIYWEKEMILTARIDKIVEHIKNNLSSRRAIISLWSDTFRENSFLSSACIHTFYFRVKLGNELEMHTHARANDLYNCVFLDLQFINFVHRMVASKIGMKVGKHIHFVDALHIFKKDLYKIENQTNFMEKSELWHC